MKYRSRPASVENVKRFFSNTSSDSVSIQDAFIAWGRDLQKKEENRSWLSNKLTSLKYHDLVVPVYSFKNGHRELDRLQLTLEGKRAIGRIAGETNGNSIVSRINDHTNFVDLRSVMKLVAKLREENPEFEITFDMKLKNG